MEISPKNINIKVSVIVATYRRDESLKRALESLIKQNYDNIEIIVVDDNAEVYWNSKVKKIVEEINRIYPIKYIVNKINNGSAKTRNIGINNATGQYITFLDDDDIYLENKVKSQLYYMIKNNCDYSITDLALYYEDGKFIEKRTRKYIKSKKKEDLLRYHLMYHMTGTDTFMFKKKYLMKIGCFESIDLGDEFYLMNKAINENGVFGYDSNCYVKAYVHKNTSGLSSGEDKINGENNLYEYKRKHFNKLSTKEIRYIKMRHYAVLGFTELRRNNYMSFLEYAIKSFCIDPINSLLLLKKTK
ncbi:glycosyltransferase family 2 protein [Clostridium baratii]